MKTQILTKFNELIQELKIEGWNDDNIDDVVKLKYKYLKDKKQM